MKVLHQGEQNRYPCYLRTILRHRRLLFAIRESGDGEGRAGSRKPQTAVEKAGAVKMVKELLNF